MIKVDKSHFFRAALEIGQSGENDTLPYDIDAGFVRDKAEEFSDICFDLYQSIENGKRGNPVAFMTGLTIGADGTVCGGQTVRVSLPLCAKQKKGAPSDALQIFR